ncbi:Hpt domain-containing protein [Natrinema salinisoli]|uniref:Hpt domain-containing protein n=1 Tax=Natrinema salinisoli TaxID=2878535 RepID=UPI001CF04557|nr:Hpt domain-containing protein [Natrinema salinisoli]
MTDYLTDFVQESEERITELNNALLTLERDPDNEEAMENIFRIAHTLKGNCGAMGLESASDLAHAIEDLLDAVRADEIPVTTDLMDSIFDAVDELETMVDEVADDGEIETDPSATIRALRDHLAESDDAIAGITRPTADEIADVCSRFDPPADEGHDVYLARLAIAEEPGVNNGKLVVDALIDAFDLIGTEPPRETIEAAEYGGSFDAVFATAVGEAAIASGLEPVEEVDDFEIVDATDGFDEESAPAQQAEEAEPGSDISSDEAMDLAVDDLLDEFDEFDDLDEMVEDVEDEDLDAFEDMGEAGSFDDLLDDADVDELDAEPGEPPADSREDDAKSSEPASADAAGSGGESTDDAEDEEVEDAGAVFNELKDEVEMVGFDELQDELEELEFDEFDDEEEVDMDELLGDEADDDSFLEDVEPSEDEVDDILVDADPADDGESASDEAAGTEETTVTTDADVASPANGNGSDATDAIEFDDDDGVAATDTEDDVTATTGEADASTADGLEASPSAEDDNSQPADSEAAVPSDGPTDGTGFESETSDDVPTEEDAVVDARSDEEGGAETTTDEPVADGTVADDTVADEADSGAVVDADIADDDSDDAGADEDPSDTVGIEDPIASPPADENPAEEMPSGTDTDDENEDTDDATAFDSDEMATSPSAEESTEPGDEPATADHETDETATADLETDETATADHETDETATADLETDETATSDEPDDAVEAETVDESTSESFGDAVESEFEPTATFDDDLESAEDDSDPFEDAGFSDSDDDFEDVGFSDPDDGAFDDPLEEQPDDEAFTGTEEFDTADSGFDSPSADPETAVDTSLETTSSFGDDAADSDDDEDVVRTVEEPEMEIPDISLPETSDRPDTESEAGEIQSVRVDVEQIDSLLTLVEGLVTSRVRLRHAADESDGGTALDKELDALSDLTTDLQETVMDIRLVPLQTVTNRLPRVVRDIARDQDKEVAFEMTGEDVELDRSILDRIGDPLIHLVRNAVDHGIEPPAQREEAGKPREGVVEVRAERARDQVTITVEDDGSGLDPSRLRSEAIEAGVLDAAEAESMPDGDAYELIFHPGLSTADEVTDVSGRGVGMDVVKRTIEDLDGTVSVDSDENEGTTVTMTLPVTVAIDEILFIESGGEEFGIPTKAVQDIEPATAIETIGNESVLAGEDGEYPVIQLADVLETPAPGGNGNGMVVRIRDDVREVALHCDHVEGQQEVVVKPFEGVMGGIPGLSGATVRGRGEVVNILDVSTL